MKWKVVDLIVRVLLALAFAMAALGKLVSHPGVLQMFENYGFPPGFHLFIGAFELFAAGLVLIPRTRYYGLLMMSIIIIGATVTHLRFDPPMELLRPLILGVLVAVAAYLARLLPAKNGT